MRKSVANLIMDLSGFFSSLCFFLFWRKKMYQINATKIRNSHAKKKIACNLIKPILLNQRSQRLTLILIRDC